MQSIQEFFVEYINNPIIATLFIAILPIFELRGAIPFGMSTALWGAKALEMGTAFLVGFIGSSVVVPIVALAFKPILEWLKRTKIFNKFAIYIEDRVKDKSSQVSNKTTRWKKMIGLAVFVAIPLPLTGVYTGTMIGVIAGLTFSDILISVISGNLIAGIIITMLSSISDNAANWILIIFIISIFAIMLISLIKRVIYRHKAS